MSFLATVLTAASSAVALLCLPSHTSSAGRSSTGVVAINAVLLPESSQVLIWSRVHMDLSRDNYEPGVISSDGVPEVTAVYDPTNGEYSVKRMRLTPFCTGNSHLADGRVFAAGGDDFAGDR
jgi:hypothetical protein